MKVLLALFVTLLLSLSAMGQVDPYGVIDAIIGKSAVLPASIDLSRNFPNPFNPTTTMSFSLPEAGDVSLETYNIRGQLVRTLVDKRTPAGYHEVTWDGRDQSDRAAASGVYFFRLELRTLAKPERWC